MLYDNGEIYGDIVRVSHAILSSCDATVVEYTYCLDVIFVNYNAIMMSYVGVPRLISSCTYGEASAWEGDRVG